MTPLDESQILERLARLPGWQRRDSEITRTWSFADFKGSLAFVNRVAELANAMDHHPDIDIRYTKITCSLSTHSAGGITEKDLAMAGAIEAVKGKG